MHRTCKNTSVKPDRRYWMTRSERLCEENLSMSLLKGMKLFWCSSFLFNWNWQIRLRKPYRHWSDVKWQTESLEGKLFEKLFETRHAGSWLSRLPLTRNGKQWQVRRLASQSVSPDQMGVFVGSGPKWSAATPCWFVMQIQQITNRLEVLHLFRCFTHTQTHTSRFVPKKATFCHPLNAGYFGAPQATFQCFGVPDRQELSIEMC